LYPNTRFRDGGHRRRGEEDVEKEKRTGKAYERYEAHQGLDDSLEPYQEAHGTAHLEPSPK